jgi:hypothetical protein
VPAWEADGCDDGAAANDGSERRFECFDGALERPGGRRRLVLEGRDDGEELGQLLG